MEEKERNLGQSSHSEESQKNAFKYYISVKFPNNAKGYYFGCDIDDIKIGDNVVVENAYGIEIAVANSELIPISKYKESLELKRLTRKATNDDMLLFEYNNKKSVEALKITSEEVARLKLDMNLISAMYSLDGSKVTITYVSENRVDFRELLKSLASRLRCRIELRQVGARDRAKSIGGIGPCGLPLCCASFLNEFDGISINKAKNQMLALNISKLSGHCGKLICCLNFEDHVYTEEKEKFPPLGTIILVGDKEYKVTGFNIISKMVKVESDEDIQTLPLDQVKKSIKYEKRPKLQKQ